MKSAALAALLIALWLIGCGKREAQPAAGPQAEGETETLDLEALRAKERPVVERKPPPSAEERARQAAIDALQQVGATLTRDEEGEITGVVFPEHADDVAVAPLVRLPQLIVLSLASDSITDESLETVAALDNLRELSLYGGQITDEGVAQLSSLTQLRRLELTGVRITNAGAKNLADLPNLEMLDLSWTKIGDDALPHLADLPRLRRLVLGQTAISDAGLAHLEQASNLQELVVANTDVTPAGLQKLRSARPDLSISSSFDIPPAAPPSDESAGDSNAASPDDADSAAP